jgi:hypothetical protein
LVAITSTLLGVIVAGGLQYYTAKKQDERRFKDELVRKRERDYKRKVAAYRRLNSFIVRIKWKRFDPTQGPQRLVSKDELEGIEAVVAENYDVLDPSTLTAWDKKFVLSVLYNPELTAQVSFDEFIADVEKHYKEYSPKPAIS